MIPRLTQDQFGRSVLEDSDGMRWHVREESPHLVFRAESGERLLVPLPEAWEQLSADELEAHRRAAQPVDAGQGEA